MKVALKSNKPVRARWRPVLTSMLVLAVVAVIALYLAASAFPAVGAQGADVLRSVIGDPAVAQLETWVFQVQDGLHQLSYRLGAKKPVSPWQAPSVALVVDSPTPSPSPTTTETPTPSATPLPSTTPIPSATPTATLTPTPTPWKPAAAHALGSLEGEGAWQAYLKDPHGQVVAFRTFIQPDPKRPYSLVAVVAFDLTRTHLNFVLGWDEPSIKDGPKGSGVIPAANAQPDRLLATFNGGFKAEHGKYGAMADGVTAIPARKDLATLVIYQDGSVQIGTYGKDILSLENARAWRQNCSLIIEDGQINPLVNNNSAEFWGANLHGETVTWRSGVGISPDGKTMYYFAGPNLMMPVLAAAMQAVNVKAALQLDINNYWVHFAAIRNVENKAVPEALFPDEMKSDVGRYLTRYARDFFYVSLKDSPVP